MSGREIARLCGLSHKQTCDALNALYNQGRIARTGRKTRASWMSLNVRQAQEVDKFSCLEAAFRSIVAVGANCPPSRKLKDRRR